MVSSPPNEGTIGIGELEIIMIPNTSTDIEVRSCLPQKILHTEEQCSTSNLSSLSVNRSISMLPAPKTRRKAFVTRNKRLHK